MESEFLLNFKDLSIEIVVISLIVFGLTMLIKWPIKKLTAKFDENKRKAINTVIVFIPILLAFTLNILYFGIFEHTWCESKVFESAGTSYLLAVAIYAIYSRIVIVIKGAKGQNKTEENLSKETISYIKSNIKTISKTLKVDESKLESIVSKIENLIAVRDEINNNVTSQDLSATEKLDKEIEQLKLEEKSLRTNIGEGKEKLLAYKNSITKKGE